MSNRPDHSVRSFVRNAWALLAFQLVAAAAAVAVTAWAALQVRPLLAERDRLSKSIVQLQIDEKRARDTVLAIEKRAAALRAELEGARKATPVLTAAINDFHAKRYGRAIVKYDQALRLNPGDPYIYNLKSYSQFKAGDFQGAIQTVSRALAIDPTYDWGYFDLARYQCAAGSPRAGLRTITDALQARGQGIQAGIKYFLSKDAEFPRLCSGILAELRKLAETPQN